MKVVATKNKGFTIIEVVLVLAIAGLIFAIVFLAVPALQTSRRDTQRRSDAGRFAAQLEQYAANNNGAYPTAANLAAFRTEYMGGNKFQDPLGGAYNVSYNIDNADIPGNKTIYFATSKRCGNDGLRLNGPGVRTYAVVINVEGGGGYCIDNS